MTKMNHLIIFLIVFMVFTSGLFLCNASAEGEFKKFQKGDKFVIALIPEKNVFEQRKRYKHITLYLSRKLDLDVHAHMLSSYGAICNAFLSGEVDAGFFGSFSYLVTHDRTGAEPVARPVWLNGSSTYSSYIFTRKNSGIRTIEDMKGKSLVLVHKATTAGYIFQLAYLRKHGISDMEDHFSEIYYAGSHDASAWSVYTGEADVGGGKNHIFNALKQENPDFSEKMIILAESRKVPSNGLAVSRLIDPALKEKIRALLLNLKLTNEGRRVLRKFGASEFIETTNIDYLPLQEMIEEVGVDLSTYTCKPR